ncbi:unnamed protein product, partial [Clonostachys solani]
PEVRGHNEQYIPRSAYLTGSTEIPTTARRRTTTTPVPLERRGGTKSSPILPDDEYGTCVASGAVKDIPRTFPSIPIVLMVGIGGGAPSNKKDIILGDFVVRFSSHGKCGVIKYDTGTAISPTINGALQRNPRFKAFLSAGLRSRSAISSRGHTWEYALLWKFQQRLKFDLTEAP